MQNQSVRRAIGEFAVALECRLAAYYNVEASALVQLGRASAAMALNQKALDLVAAELKDKGPAEQVLYSTADSYTGMGDTEFELAKQNTRGMGRIEHLRTACGWYERSLKTWSAIPEPGVESPLGFESVLPAAVTARLNRCRAAQKASPPNVPQRKEPVLSAACP
jgi:hypothetical protein